MYENEQGFLDTIIANPCDDDLKLIYADWLIEHGDERGELILAQCRNEKYKVSVAKFRTWFLPQGIKNTFKISPRKNGLLAVTPSYNIRFGVLKGFISDAYIDSNIWFELGPHIVKRNPISCVTLRNVYTQLIAPSYTIKRLYNKEHFPSYQFSSAAYLLDSRLFFDTDATFVEFNTNELRSDYKWISNQCIKWARAQNE